jgi:hypothetical protein
MEMGPLQLVVAAFEGDVMESGVVDELFAATADSGVKLLDVIVVDKDEEGQVWTSELSDLTFEEEIRYGEVISGLLALGGEAPADPKTQAEYRLDALAHFVLGLTPGQVSDLIDSFPAGHSGIVALFEHAWARELRQATLKEGGVILAQALLEPRGLVQLAPELQAALETAARVEEAEVAAAEGENSDES